MSIPPGTIPVLRRGDGNPWDAGNSGKWELISGDWRGEHICVGSRSAKGHAEGSLNQVDIWIIANDFAADFFEIAKNIDFRII